jgi:hypothetical protein
LVASESASFLGKIYTGTPVVVTSENQLVVFEEFKKPRREVDALVVGATIATLIEVVDVGAKLTLTLLVVG